jgi:hypothetical protein
MAEQTLYPSLSEDGWVTSPERTADYLLASFIVADYSQTYMYPGMVSSLPWILQNNLGDTPRAAIEIQRALDTYFSRYFTNIVSDVKQVPNVENPAKEQLSIYLKFDDDTGKSHVLGRLLQMSNSLVESIVKINNG